MSINIDTDELNTFIKEIINNNLGLSLLELIKTSYCKIKQLEIKTRNHKNYLEKKDSILAQQKKYKSEIKKLVDS